MVGIGVSLGARCKFTLPKKCDLRLVSELELRVPGKHFDIRRFAGATAAAARAQPLR